MCLLILTPFLRKKMNTIKRREAELVGFWKTTLCHVVPQQQNLLSPAASLACKMNVFFPLPPVLKVIIYLGNRTEAVGAKEGTDCAFSREELTKWVLFSVNVASQGKPGTVEENPAEATSLHPPRPPLVSPLTAVWALESELLALAPWKTSSLFCQERALSPELTREVPTLQCSLHASVSQLHCRKINPVVRGSDVSAWWLRLGTQRCVWKGLCGLRSFGHSG